MTIESLLGRRQTSGLHRVNALLLHALVHVKRKRHTESEAYTVW